MCAEGNAPQVGVCKHVSIACRCVCTYQQRAEEEETMNNNGLIMFDEGENV